MSGQNDEEIVLPRKWRNLSEKEQIEWIRSYFTPKVKMPEPILKRDEKIVRGYMRTESGVKLKFPKKPMTVSRRNHNLKREFEAWVGKWLVTVFHDKRMPHVKYLGIANPSGDKWIAQELSSEICNEFYAILLRIRWKYGFFKGKRRKETKKSSNFTLSLKDSNMMAGELE